MATFLGGHATLIPVGQIQFTAAPPSGSPGWWETMCNNIRSHFKTNVADVVGSTTVLYDNDGANTKPDNARWVRLAIRPATDQQASLGSTPRYRTFGVMIAQVFVPVSEGDQAALALGDIIASAFRGQAVSGVQFRTPIVQFIGRDGDDWQVNVNCPFYVDNIDS